MSKKYDSKDSDITDNSDTDSDYLSGDESLSDDNGSGRYSDDSDDESLDNSEELESLMDQLNDSEPKKKRAVKVLNKKKSKSGSSNKDSKNLKDKTKKSSKSDKKDRNKVLPVEQAVRTTDEKALYVKVKRYFRDECSRENIEKMVKIINSEMTTSLRLVNWFAMKYSATMPGIKKDHDDLESFDVRISYRARLNVHSKKYFDPFRRGKRFMFPYDPTDPSKKVETALCQLNFFRWLFMHDLMEYIEDNIELLKQKMGTFEKKKKEIRKKENNKKKKKKIIVKNKKEAQKKLNVKRYTDKDSSKLVIFM